MLDDLNNWFFNSVWDPIKNFFLTLMTTLLDILKDTIFWIFDILLSFVVGLLGLIDLSGSLINPSSLFSNIPEDITNIWGLLGIGPALAIVVAALVVRLLLQLIPFVRLGS